MGAFYTGIIVFLFGYLLNIFYITVFYHRGLAHKSLELSPSTIKWISRTGVWVTGIDPKAWVCMHRLHHEYSDTMKDPHSPMHRGVFGVAIAQLRYYEKTIIGLMKQREPYASAVKDIQFDISLLNRLRLWWIPYVFQILIAVVFAWALHSWMIGVAYWMGIMSHPVQGWLVNSLAHRFGYRNFQTDDNSRNNTLVAWFVMGEGYQNNHHTHPASAKFSMKWYEIDFGYLLCLIAARSGMLKITTSK